MKLKSDHPLADGLVCSYLMNEGGGNKIFDASGNQNHGTFTNSIPWGRDGIEPPGDNEHITIPKFIDQDGDWTIFFSFIQDTRNPNTQTKQSHFMSMVDGGSGTGRSILLINDVGADTFKMASYIDGTENESTSVINTGESYTCGLTQDGTAFKYFLNGIPDGSFIATATACKEDVLIFDRKDGLGDACFDGLCNVFHMYDRPLTEEEMAWLDYDPFGMFEADFIPTNYSEISAIIDVYLTLSQNLNIIKSGHASAQGPVVLSNTLAAIDAARAVTGGAVALSSSLAAVDGGNADSQGLMVVPYYLAFTAGADAVAESTLSMANILSAAESATANTSASLSLSDILTIAQATEDHYYVDVSLSEVLAVLQGGVATTDGNVSLSDVLTTTLSGSAVAEAIVAFSESLAIAQTTAEITQVYLTLAYNLAVQSGAVSTAASTLALAINAGISASVTINVDESLSLSESFGLSQAGQANAQGPVSLSKTLALSILAEAVVAAGLSLDAVISISTNYETITVVTPDGRTVVIAVELRQTLISEEDRTVTIT